MASNLFFIIGAIVAGIFFGGVLLSALFYLFYFGFYYRIKDKKLIRKLIAKQESGKLNPTPDILVKEYKRPENKSEAISRLQKEYRSLPQPKKKKHTIEPMSPTPNKRKKKKRFPIRRKQ